MGINQQTKLNLTPIDFDPFRDEVIEKTILINEAQREVWLSCTIGGDPASLAYNESVSLDLKGIFDYNAFEKALNKVVERHEALRSAVSPNGSYFMIYENFRFKMEFTDLSAYSMEEQQDHLEIFVNQEMDTPFSLETSPLFRYFLHKLADDHYYFTLVIHHIIADGWSLGVLLEDLSAIYNGYVRNIPADLPELFQISDYALEEARFSVSEEFKITENYWLDIYSSKIPVLDLPTDFPRPVPRSYSAKRLDQQLPAQLAEQLKILGSSQGCSFLNTLLSGFEIFLSLKAQQNDIVIGLPSAGQSATEMFHMIGHCVNLMPLRSKIDPSLSFKGYLIEQKSVFFDAYDHQRISFGQLVKKLNIKRDPSRIPLVPVMFNIDMGMDSAVFFDGLEHRVISNPRTHETFEIFLNATESQGTFILEWTYNTQLFKAGTIETMMRDFEQMLSTLVSYPDELLNKLFPALVFDGISNTIAKGDSDQDTDRIFTHLIDKQASRHPDKIAVSFRDQQLSYFELVEKSNQVAGFLIEKGIHKGDIVALAVERSAEMIITLLGIVKAGAIYLPLDPDYPKERLEFMLSDSAAKLLLTSSAYHDYYICEGEEVRMQHIFDQLQNYSKTTTIPIDGQDLAYILYTSGSTGKPKGVKISHHNLSNFLISMQISPEMDASDRLLAITTISFDIAGLELYLPLITGAEIVLADTEQARDGRILVHLLEEGGITVMQATPSTWQMVIDSGWDRKLDLKVLSGGEALTMKLATELLKRSRQVWNMYGPTETTIWSTVKKISDRDPSITIGNPILNTQIYILDENLRQVAQGEPGEICIGGLGVAQGYLNRADLSADKFVDDHFRGIEGYKIYRTGDLGKELENGEFQCLGRMDQQVKIRGHRIEPGEIESSISSLPGIKQAVVIARENSAMEKHLLAYVILKETLEENDGLSWKERWDAMYDIGADNHKDLDGKDTKLDDTLLEHYHNSSELALQSVEWLQSSISRIKELRPKNIYEIGSGAGQILFELAPEANGYVATDYANTAIEKLVERLDADPDQWKNVRAKTAPADDFSFVDGEKFDLVLIHSVAQYFKNADYLVEVVRKAASVIDNGCIFIGDMQGKNSLEMCHAIDHLPRSTDGSSVEEFKRVVLNRVRIEDEFVADPAFFYNLPKLIPEITNVNIQLREGQLLNETTRYHYDVWLYIGESPAEISAETILDWNEDTDLRYIENLLSQYPSKVIEVKNVLNARTSKDLLLWKLVNSSSAETKVGEIKAKLTEDNGMSPQTIWDIARQCGFKAHIKWTTDGSDGLFNVFFIPGSMNCIPKNPYKPIERKEDIYRFARTPFTGNEISISAETVESWKKELKKILPGYMIPESFMALKQLPLTANAKIDRNALPEHLLIQPLKSERGDESVTKNEQFVANIWSEILGIRNIGINDDFFELGGHSILAVKVMVRIEKETGQRIPIAAIFENPTVKKLAKLVQENSGHIKFESLIPLKNSGGKIPAYMVHGGGLNALTFNSVVQYMDEDQPAFGIQSLGLNGEASPLYTIEDLADYYKQFILQNDPEGPYILIGYSFGGLLVFEMARQLAAMGKEVRKVIIIDTYVGDISLNNKPGSKLLTKILRQFNKLLHFSRLFLQEPKEVYDYQLAFLKDKLKRLNRHQETAPEETLTYYTEIEKSYDTAYWSYVITPQNVKVDLLKVKKRIYFLDDPMYLGWRPFAKGGIKIHEVPGDHKTFMSPPNDQKFARILQDVIDER